METVVSLGSGETEGLIGELEAAIKDSSPEKVAEWLQGIAALLFRGVERFTEEQIDLLDEVLCRLAARVVSEARTKLSLQLAPFSSAPGRVILQLARDHEISVAEPVLSAPTKLSAGDLIEIAQTRSQDHLRAISTRPALEEAVTDIALQLGGQKVLCLLARNHGARFSESGLSILADRSERDDELAESVLLRKDVPAVLRRELTARVPRKIRNRLLTAASHEPGDDMHRSPASDTDPEDGAAAAPRRYPAVSAFVAELVGQGQQLIGTAVSGLARRTKSSTDA
jgi:uncharacterized protein (DUF2336 family)